MEICDTCIEILETKIKQSSIIPIQPPWFTGKHFGYSPDVIQCPECGAFFQLKFYKSLKFNWSEYSQQWVQRCDFFL